MPKKFIAAGIAAFFIIGLGIFSLSNVLAVYEYDLQRAKEDCEVAQNGENIDVPHIMADQSLSESEKQRLVAEIQNNTKGVCDKVTYYENLEANFATEQKEMAVRDCKLYKQQYKSDIAEVKAKALSHQLPADILKGLLKGVKERRDFICADAGDPFALARMCMALRKSYGKNVKSIKAKALSSSLSQETMREFIQTKIKSLKNRKKDMCVRAKAARKSS